MGHEDVTHFYCSEILPRKIDMDLEYVRTRTLRADALLLLRTSCTPPVRVIRGALRGAHGTARDGFAQVAWCALVFALVCTFAVSSVSV